jgi:hemoglobin
MNPPSSTSAENANLEAAIDACVSAFYAKGGEDPLLGPIFSKIPHLDEHLDIVVAFWSRELLRTARYEGTPFAVHINLPVEPQHFERWMGLFSQSARETLPPATAERAIAKAAHMTRSFMAGIFPFTDADGRPSRTPA